MPSAQIMEGIVNTMIQLLGERKHLKPGVGSPKSEHDTLSLYPPLDLSYFVFI